MAHVFVYGTLMRGGANHAVMERLGARYVAAARTKDPRMLVDLGPYPALLAYDQARDALASNVHGEIFVVGETALPALDAFEDCPTLYTRDPIVVVAESGELEAWTYVFARRTPASATVVVGGRYGKSGTVLAHGAHPSQVEIDSNRNPTGGSDP